MLAFNEKIKSSRLKQNLTVYRLAKITGLNESTINELEKGIIKNPRIRTIVLLSRALSISLDELFEQEYLN